MTSQTLKFYERTSGLYAETGPDPRLPAHGLQPAEAEALVHAHTAAPHDGHSRSSGTRTAPLVGDTSSGAKKGARKWEPRTFDNVTGRQLPVTRDLISHFLLDTPRLVLIGSPGDRPWLNILLVLIPLAFVAGARNWPAGATFALALISMIPLAERLGFATENVAEYLGDTVGGLMNATMGNAPELIISLFALRDGLLRVVQLSLLGSVLSNLLLVLGTAFFLGGIRYNEQTFNSRVTQVNAALLLLAVMCLLLPAVLVASNTETNPGSSALLLSRIVAILMLLVYVCFLVFQLKTHAHLFSPEDAAASEEDKGDSQPLRPSALDSPATQPLRDGSVTDASTVGVLALPAGAAALATAVETHTNGDASAEDVENGAGTGAAAIARPAVAADSTPEDSKSDAGSDDSDDEAPVLTLWEALAWLAGISAIIAALSETLVGSIEGASQAAKIPDLFISCILLPIAGNAAEHASAIIFAMRNRLDLAIGIAIGSATQISMFVLPLCILVGWIMGQPLSLDFAIYETAVFFITTLVATQITTNGSRTNYLMGISLVFAYIAIAVSFLVHGDQQP